MGLDSQAYGAWNPTWSKSTTKKQYETRKKFQLIKWIIFILFICTLNTLASIKPLTCRWWATVLARPPAWQSWRECSGNDCECAMIDKYLINNASILYVSENSYEHSFGGVFACHIAILWHFHMFELSSWPTCHTNQLVLGANIYCATGHDICRVIPSAFPLVYCHLVSPGSSGLSVCPQEMTQLKEHDNMTHEYSWQLQCGTCFHCLFIDAKK